MNVVDITEETVVVLSILGENCDDDRIEMAKDVPVSVLAREHGSGLYNSDIYQLMVDLTTRAGISGPKMSCKFVLRKRER